MYLRTYRSCVFVFYVRGSATTYYIAHTGFYLPSSLHSSLRKESSVLACQFSLCVPLSVLNHVIFTKLCEYYVTEIHPNSLYIYIYIYYFSILYYKEMLETQTDRGITQLACNLGIRRMETYLRKICSILKSIFL